MYGSLSIGTRNHDARGPMLDGDTTMIVSSAHASASLIDVHLLVPRTTWMTRRVEPDRHLGPHDDLVRRIAHGIRFVP